jgi:NADH dehydrogenase FAD-containing subunit
MVNNTYAPRAWRQFKDLEAFKSAPISFIQAHTMHIDPEHKTVRARTVGSAVEVDELYDYLVVASGLRRVWPVVPQSLYKEEYLKEHKAHLNSIQGARRGVVVIGGGQ